MRLSLQQTNRVSKPSEAWAQVLVVKPIGSRRRIVLLVFALGLAVLLVPYAFSRLVSPWRCLTVYEDSNAVALAADDKAPLRIACYNIAHGRGQSTGNWTGETAEERFQRLDDISDLLRSANADIVVLNEVDFDSSWSHSVNQAEYIAKAAGYPYRAEQRNLDFRILFWKWRFGNAVLSRYPIQESRRLNFPSYSMLETILAGKKRGLQCMIDVDGKSVAVAGVHLSHRSEALRARSTEILDESKPTFIAGDFNSTPIGFPGSVSDPDEGNTIDRLDALSFQRRPESPPTDTVALTYHSAEPKSVIDWIMVSKDWAVLEYEVVPSLLSDHRLVVGSFAPAADLGTD